MIEILHKCNYFSSFAPSISVLLCDNLDCCLLLDQLYDTHRLSLVQHLTTYSTLLLGNENQRYMMPETQTAYSFATLGPFFVPLPLLDLKPPFINSIQKVFLNQVSLLALSLILQLLLEFWSILCFE